MIANNLLIHIGTVTPSLYTDGEGRFDHYCLRVDVYA